MIGPAHKVVRYEEDQYPERDLFPGDEPVPGLPYGFVRIGRCYAVRHIERLGCKLVLSMEANNNRVGFRVGNNFSVWGRKDFKWIIEYVPAAMNISKCELKIALINKSLCYF
jgi:hypothetical protein